MTQTSKEPLPLLVSHRPEASAAAKMWSMTAGSFIRERCIHVAAELGLADLLHPGPLSVQELSVRTGTHEDALARVLRVLISEGIFAQRSDGLIQTNELADTLRSDAPGSQRAWIRYGSSESALQIWSHMMACVRNGRSLYENVHGKPFFAWHAENPACRALFDESMAGVSRAVLPALVSAFDPSGVHRVMDVGGGMGGLLAALLSAHPQLRGVLFDQPEALEHARAGGPLGTADLQSRAELVPGDFFRSVPPGCDAYLLKWILHDWDDVQALQILTNIRKSARPGAKLLIIEMILNPEEQPSMAKVMDVAMLALTGGRERTEAEFGRLLQSAGFELRRAVATSSPYHIIEGVAV